MADLILVVTDNLAVIIAPMDQLGPRAVRAMNEGLREGGDKVRTKVRRALKTQTNVKRYGAIVERTSSYAADLTYTIRGSSKPLPIPQEIPTRGRAGGGWMRWSRREHWKLQGRTSGGRFGPLKDVKPEVTSSPWAVSRTFQRSFVDPKRGMRAAIPGGSGKWSFRKLFGPSVAKEIVKGQSAAAFNASVRADVLPPILKRLARVLPG